MGSTLRRRTLAAALAIGSIGTVAVVPATTAGAAGPGLTRYHVRADLVTTDQFDAESGPCGSDGTATFTWHASVEVAATVAGLTDDQVVALLGDDPDGVLRQVRQSATGTVTIVTGGHTYSGRATQGFNGNFLPNGMYVNHGEFSVTATSELGTLLRISSQGFNVDDFDGITVHAGFHGDVSGCLP
jgi:hypothetical protein